MVLFFRWGEANFFVKKTKERGIFKKGLENVSLAGEFPTSFIQLVCEEIVF